jgi:hypothetical protein
MKKKAVIISLSFALMVLSAILLQSVHSYHHLEKFISEKHCNHTYAENKTEINHSHHDLDHCFACEFTFSTSIKSEFFTFTFYKIQLPVGYTFSYSKEITNHFKGSLFSLRAPPSFIA